MPENREESVDDEVMELAEELLDVLDGDEISYSMKIAALEIAKAELLEDR